MSESEKKGPELFFGLIGAIGTELEVVAKTLEDSLKKVGYKSKKIVLSDLIKTKVLHDEEPYKNQYERIKTLQDAGDQFREKIGDGGAIASLAIGNIRKLREEKTGDANKRSPNVAYILKSLKHKEETQKLRKIYGKNFWVVSAYTPENLRIAQLNSRIKSDLDGGEQHKSQQYTAELIDRDMYKLGTKFGQDVRGTFPEGDVFFDVSESSFKLDVDRFIELIFNNTFKTPTIEEYGMFHAYASAFRSSSLSRQVGASIISKNGDIICTGTNEVPKFGGGHYVEGDKNDKREFQIGEDSNHVKRNEMLRDVFDRIKKEKWFKDDIMLKNPSELVDLALDSDNLKEINFLNVTEFGREVHAEMSALMDASRKTVSVKEGKLFCTTFPCHVCAKHIIAAGIEDVVYISPYSKSLAKDLFKDSISVDEDPFEDSVQFKPFVGIAPKRYMDLFEMTARKDKKTGKKIDWDSSKALPRYEESKPYPDDEAKELTDLANKQE